MNNKKGFILSIYIYILLAFFLLLLGTMLVVLNNTKILSKRIKEDSVKSSVINNEVNFLLKGDLKIEIPLHFTYEEPGFVATKKNGEDLSDLVEIESNVNSEEIGNYSIYYTFTYSNKTYTLERKVIVTHIIKEFAYTESVQSYSIPINGYYQIELWGAEGGSAKYATQYYGGKGGYTKGTIYLEKNEIIYLYVGSKGKSYSGTSADTLLDISTGYNGGNIGGFFSNNSMGGGGGGATDVRYGGISLNNRIMVAAGGGGADSHSSAPGYSGNGGDGGGLIGSDGSKGNANCYNLGVGATQINGGISSGAKCNQSKVDVNPSGLFGIGGIPQHSGGGSGYYGGGAGIHASAGGGSSYISGHQGCIAINNTTPVTAKCTITVIDDTPTTQDYINVAASCSEHFSGKVFIETRMIDGEGYLWTNKREALSEDILMPNPAGGYYASGVGHAGNGYARITYRGINP